MAIKEPSDCPGTKIVPVYQEKVINPFYPVDAGCHELFM